MSVNVEVHRYALYNINARKGSDGSIHQAWIVPAVSNTLPFLNDPRYLKGNKTLQILR